MTADPGEAWGAFQRMRNQLTGRINRELARSTGLSEADYEVLISLDETEDKSLQSLAIRCGLDWEKSRLSHQLRRMETRGLIVKEPCVEDRRATTIRLTDAGLAAVNEARDCHSAAVAKYFGDVLTGEQLAAMESISANVIARLDLDRPAGHHHRP